MSALGEGVPNGDVREIVADEEQEKMNEQTLMTSYRNYFL